MRSLDLRTECQESARGVVVGGERARQSARLRLCTHLSVVVVVSAVEFFREQSYLPLV